MRRKDVLEKIDQQTQAIIEQLQEIRKEIATSKIEIAQAIETPEVTEERKHD